MADEMSERDKAIIIAMREYKLEPGQMLFLGPKSCAIIAGDAPVGKLSDKYVIPREEWNSEQDR